MWFKVSKFVSKFEMPVSKFSFFFKVPVWTHPSRHATWGELGNLMFEVYPSNSDHVHLISRVVESSDQVEYKIIYFIKSNANIFVVVNFKP